MARMLNHIKESIKNNYVPLDQKYMTESFVIGSVIKTMSCEIFPDKNQEHLLCQFDKQGLNSNNFPYYNPVVDGLVSMCDYILFVEENDRMLVLMLELKHNESPRRQVEINESFGRFICERLKVIFNDFDKPIVYRKIGVKEKYNPLHSTQEYVFFFDKQGYAQLPNPHKLLLGMVSKVISMEEYYA